MDVNYELSGKKGSRKVVKTISVSEGSFLGLKNVIDGNVDSITADNISISDVHRVFGGNCYSMVVGLAVEYLIGYIVFDMSENGILAVDGEKACEKLSAAIIPIMCSCTFEDGTSEELRFFNSDVEDVISSVSECLKKEKADFFSEHLKESLVDNDKVAGEVALGILLYLSTECVDDNKDNSLAS